MKNKPDRAIVVERTVSAGGFGWPLYDVMRSDKLLSPSPFRHKSKAQAWAADWNRKNVPKAADLKAARQRVALIERFIVPVEPGTAIQLCRMYGDGFNRKLVEAYCLLCDCREIVLDAEKKEPEPTT